MKVFDCHFHVDKGINLYNIVEDRKNVIFNYIEQYQALSENIEKRDSISLIFDYRNHFDFIKKQITQGNIQALKIHSRIQKISDKDYNNLFNAFESIETKGLHVIIDAFYYGSDYEFQPNLKRIIELVKLFPETKFIIAHSGGIRVLEYFLHLKNIKNVYFDLSFSLTYLKNASVFQDFKVLIKYGDHQNILFGTDFPFINAKDQLDIFLEIATTLKITDEGVHNMLYANSNTIFNKLRP